jgi:hypothetical protein
MNQLEEAHLREREAEKKDAIAALHEALASIEQQHREPDQWERVHFVHGLASLFSGAYSLAACEADLAQTPPADRSPTVKLPADLLFDRCNIALLRRVLAAAEAEPVREFPSFGPVVITGEAVK